MERLAITLLLILSLAFMFHAPASAQNATPEGMFGRRGTPGSDEFAYRSPEGEELATYSLVEVIDPFEQTSEFFQAPENATIVAIVIQVENTGSTQFEVVPGHLVLQDTFGTMWSQVTITRDAEDFDIPDLQSVTMAPGDVVIGLVGFAIPEDADPGALLLNPNDGRLLTVAQLNEIGDGVGAIGDPVAFSFVGTGMEGTFTLTDLADPYEDYPEGGAPTAGMRYVTLSVTFENTGSATLDIGPDWFVVQDSDGYLWGTVSLQLDPDSTVPLLESRSLAPGSRLTGVVGFEIPEESELQTVFLQPDYAVLIPLVATEE